MVHDVFLRQERVESTHSLPTPSISLISLQVGFVLLSVSIQLRACAEDLVQQTAHTAVMSPPKLDKGIRFRIAKSESIGMLTSLC